jgi:hypothetical protein
LEFLSFERCVVDVNKHTSIWNVSLDLNHDQKPDKKAQRGQLNDAGGQSGSNKAKGSQQQIPCRVKHSISNQLKINRLKSIGYC